jgi:hypothetical protein
MRVNQTKIKDNERRSHQPDSYNLYHDRTFVARGKSAINQESNKIQNERQGTSKLESLGRISFYQIQLFLNLSILLMIISGFLYFFSLPFSETQSYNFNPPPFLALLVYGLDFPILFSGYFLKILSKYPDIKTMVPLVGTFYIITGYYLLNLIPFLLFYIVYRYYYHSNLANSEKSHNSLNNKKDLFSARNSKYALLGIIFALLSYSLCFPLNTYIYNEEIYGYLIYQNLVVEVYQMVFSENFVIILAMSAIGGYIGYLLSQPRSIPLGSKI